MSGFTQPVGIPCMEHAIAGDERDGSRWEDSPADPPRGGGLGGSRSIAAMLTSTSAALVAQDDTLMRIAVWRNRAIED